MKKIHYWEKYVQIFLQKHQILIIMKLTVIFICLFSLSVQATGYSQSAKVNLNLKEISLKEVFKMIEKQTPCRFFYNDQFVDLDSKVSFKANDITVDEALNIILKDANVTHKVLENNLVVIAPIDNQAKNTVSGTVTDSQTGESLPGVSIFIKGTTKGTVTDKQGKFSLTSTNPNATLVFSFIGYDKQEVNLNGNQNITVALVANVKNLDEVVVIGYGTTKKSDLTGSVGSVQGTALAKRQTTQLSSALQGAISGVMVTQNNSAPGATASIRIRGITTIGTSDPLVIIDGVPGGSIDDINPKDVESMSVLKDAAAASIYGSRAASGVILVTTKRGKMGFSNITYNFEYGIEKPTSMPTYTGAVKYMQYANEQKWNDNGNVGTTYPVFTQDYIANYAANHAANPDLYPDTDWSSLILKKSSMRQTHSLTISSGTKNLQTNASFTLDNVGALYDLRSYKRINARVNNDIMINKYLSATIDLNVKRVESGAPATGDPTFNARQAAPIYAAMWTDGLVGAGKVGANPYGLLEYGGTSNTWNNQLSGKISLDFKPIAGLKLSAVFSPTFNYDKNKSFSKAIPYTNYNDPNTYVGFIQGAVTTSLSESRNDGYFHTTQFLGNYEKSIGKHNLNVMAGYENYYSTYESLGASRDAYELTNYPYLDLGPLTLRNNSGSATENAYRSYFGRVMYNFSNKYYIQANIREDGSSRFDPKYRWGTFPSVSTGWVISSENFMKKLPVISYLKLRASWGALGNERIGNYPYQSTIAFGNTLLYQGTTPVSVTTAAQTTYAIPNISWEKTETTDFGVDLNMLKNRLRLTGDYYLKTTKDMLLALQIPPSLGFDNPNQNTGKMNTKGWEVELSWSDKIGEIGYSASVNVSDFKSKMGDLGGTEFIGDQIKVKGSEYNEWYGFVSEGLFQNAADVAASPKLYANSKPGDIKYKDISGPNGVPDGIISAQYDRVRLGGSLPRYMYGGNLQFDYKGFDLGIVFQGVGKQNARITPNMVRPLQVAWTSVPTAIEGKFWSVNNTEAQNLAARFPRLSENGANGNNYVMSDFWLFNGSYFRLKNVSLGYTIPSTLTNKIKLQSVRFYTTVSDLFSYNHYLKGWDPEVADSSYPITMSFIFGVSVKF